MPQASKDTKAAKTAAKERALFKLHSLGVVTSRDDWVYDESRSNLVSKVTHFVNKYEDERIRWGIAKDRARTGEFVSREI